MTFILTAASPRTPSCQTARLLRVLIVGPQLLANALHALLTTIDDIQVVTPISEPDQVLPFIERINSTEHPLDVIIVHGSADLEEDHLLLNALATAGQRCLMVTSFHFPNEMRVIKQAGAWGLFSTASTVQHLLTAVRTIASGNTCFPEDLQALPTRNMTSLTKPRQMVFHEERLETLAREIMWKLTPTERHLFRHITAASIKEIATTIHLSPATVRRELSERVYEFLELISGRAVSNRLVALQVLQHYGIIEYVLPLSFA